jgi:hypothetical protein
VIWHTLLTFVAMFALDYVFARYTAEVTNRAPALAGLWAVLIVFSNSIVVTNYVANFWMVLPAGAGAFLGTWLAVERDRRKNLEPQNPSVSPK